VSESRWIPVGENLPRRYDTVLAADETERITAFMDGKGKWCRHDAIEADWTPTHWMPLPDPPAKAPPQ